MKIAVADEFPIVNEGLRRAFAGRDGIDFVGYASSERDALDMLRRTQVDLLVTDLRFISGPAAFIRKVATAAPSVKVLLYPSRIGEQEAVAAIREGAAAIVLKRMPMRVMIDSVDRLSGIFGPLNRPTPALKLASRLTRREEEIVRLVTSGMRNKEIANHLSIAEGTVKVHLHAIFDKLGVGSRVELTIYGNEAGLSEIRRVGKLEASC